MLPAESRDYTSEAITAQEETPSYEFSQAEVRNLCGDFLESREIRPDSPFGCYITKGTNKYSNLGRYVESTVFSESFQNSSETMSREYGPYDQASTFFVVVDHEQQMPVGVMRIIENSPSGLKSLVDLPNTELNILPEDVYQAYSMLPDKCVDLATLAILKDYRGPAANFLPATLMYRTLYLQVLSNPEFSHVIGIVDQGAKRNLDFLKFPFKTIFDSGAFNYLDSPNSYALFAETAAFFPQLTFWTDKLKREAAANDDQRKAWLANSINILINKSELDQMLGFEMPPHQR